MPFYTVNQGDCISSIAYQSGFAPDTLWNHPNNKDLKEKRKDLNVLFPGDTVFIPDKQIRVEKRSTEARHKFKLKTALEVLSIRFLLEDKPSAGVPYTLVVDGHAFPAGTLDGDGACVVPIPPGSKKATLTLDDPDGVEVYQLLIGHLDPAEEVSGVQWRLSNLGYFNAAAGGTETTPELKAAIQAFQEDQQLPTENGLDDATLEKLKAVHGS